MITVVSRKVDFVRKIEAVLLEDEFGAQHGINHPLALPGYDAVAEEAKAVAQMEAVCDAFKLAVASRKE